MFDFREIEAFVWIVRLGSFHQAAQTLHLTQPTISDRIARLEDIVGARILDRTQRPIIPTIVGRQFYPHALDLLEARQKAVESMRVGCPYQGEFRLGVAETIAHSWLPKFIAELSNRLPGLTLQLVVDGTPALNAKLNERRLDMIFALGPVNESDIMTSFLCSYPAGLIASPEFGLDPRTFKLRDLKTKKIPLVTFARDSRPYQLLQKQFCDEGLRSLKLHCSSSVWTIVRLALDGISIGAGIPLRIVRGELTRGELVSLPCTLPDHDFNASWPLHLDSTLAKAIFELASEISNDDMFSFDAANETEGCSLNRPGFTGE